MEKFSGLDFYNIDQHLSDEERMVQDLCRSWVEARVLPIIEGHARNGTFPMELVKEIGEMGLLGANLEGYGCAGMSNIAYGLICQELERGDSGIRSFVSVQGSLAMFPIWKFGTEDQKNKYLPKLAAGEFIGCFGLTEPDHGSNPGGMLTRAVDDGDSYVLNGAKMWITNGAIADGELGDIFLVYARMEGAGRNELSMFIVEKGFEGISLGQKITDKLGMRASTTAEVVFEDCRVPAENLVGEEGSALMHMMRNLEVERVGLAAMSLGIARRSVEIMNEYAKERKSFGEPLNRFGQIQRHIAESYGEYMAGRFYTYGFAGRMSLEKPGQRLDSDGVKLYCSTMGKNVADRAIQVLGGYGYCGEYRVERLWRDAKLLEIGGGTVEAHHKNMTRELARVDKLL